MAQGLLATLGEGLRWLVLVHPDGWRGSLARMVWLIALAIAPRGLAERELRRARSQTGRSPFWQRLLSFTRPGTLSPGGDLPALVAPSIRHPHP